MNKSIHYILESMMKANYQLCYDINGLLFRNSSCAVDGRCTSQLQDWIE